MATAVSSRRNETIVAALSTHLSTLSLHAEKLSSKALEEHNLTGLFTAVLQLSPSDEVLKWINFAENFPHDSASSQKALKELDQELSPKSVLVGNGLKPSEADIVVFSALHPFVSGLSPRDRREYPNVMRWMDYIQNKEDFGGVFEQIAIEKAGFHLHDFSDQEIVSADHKLELKEPSKNAQGSLQIPSDKVKHAVSDLKEGITEKEPAQNKPSEEKKKNPEKVPADKKSSDEKKKKAVKETSEKEDEVSVSTLNIQVGRICKAWKHPSADSLLVEEIDLGDGNLRQVVSGLAKYCSPDELANRLVVLITNVKPGKLRDVMSSGLVLCASNEDHSVVEPLIPPNGAVPGERISFSGYDGEPEVVLNPKKKQLEKITPHLYTDDKGIATYRGVPFMTSAGPCTSSIAKAGIR